jgi:hypothetical protein
MRTEVILGPSVSRIARSLGCAAALVGTIVLSTAAPLAAANGDVLAISSVLVGKDLSAITLDTSSSPPGGSFWVLGRTNGKIYHLSLDLGTILGEISNPHGSGVFPNVVLSYGLAYRALSKTLFVLAKDGANWRVREVKTDGSEVPAGSFNITPPDAATAVLRGLSYDSVAREFWYLDANNDLLVRTGTDGLATKTCSLPGDTPPVTTLRGEGICFDLTQTGPETFEQRLYVSYGDIFHENPSRIIQISDTCQESGIEIPLRTIVAPAIPQGLQTFRTGQQRRVAIVTNEGKIVQVEQVIPTTVPPSQLRCALTLTNQVALGWQNNGRSSNREYGGDVILLRNGVPFVTLPGTATQYTDATPLEGTSTYALEASDAPGGATSPASQACEVTVGTGGIVRWAPLPGTAPFDVAQDPSTGEIYVSDNVGIQGQGRIFRFDSTLKLLGEVPNPWQRPAAHGPGVIAFLSTIKLAGQDFQNLLAVGRTDGALVRIMDVHGNEKTTLVMENIGTPGSLTYIPTTQQFALLDTVTSKIHFNDSTGRFLRECSPPELLALPLMDSGLTYDPLRDTFLATFKDGVVRELYLGGGGNNCVPPDPDFGINLKGLGEGFTKPGFTGGIQIAANTLLVCGKTQNALFQVLIFPSGPSFSRGDVDRNNAVNLSDAVACAKYLFQSGPAPTCQDAADINDDGILDVSDPVYLLFHLFLQGPPPPPPFPGAGSDPTFRDNLGCEEV